MNKLCPKLLLSKKVLHLYDYFRTLTIHIHRQSIAFDWLGLVGVYDVGITTIQLSFALDFPMKFAIDTTSSFNSFFSISYAAYFVYYLFISCLTCVESGNAMKVLLLLLPPQV